jgi:hypothetical protein
LNGEFQKDVKGLVVMSGLLFALLIDLSYPHMLRFGITGVGYTWVASYGIGAVIGGVMVRRAGVGLAKIFIFLGLR